MATSASTDVPLERDALGFLLHAEQWSEQVAERIARENGIARLTTRQWEVILAMRTAFLERGSLPWLQMISSVSGVSIQELYRLLPRGPLEARGQDRRNPEAPSLHLGGDPL